MIKRRYKIGSVFLFLAATLLLYFAARTLAEKLNDATIAQALQRGETILVSTDKGLYQTSTKEKQWHKIETPPDMKPGGTLVQQGADSPLLAYYLRGSEYIYPGAPTDALYLSRDSGKTWEPVPLAPLHHLTAVFIHPDGSLFVCDTEHTAAVIPSHVITGARVMWSKDLGATWKDITTNLPNDYGFYQILRDPDHPDLVCVTGALAGFASAPCVFQADDSTYQWKQKGMEVLDQKVSSTEKVEKIGRGYAFSYRFSIKATLSNFFTLPFLKSGYELALPGIQVKSEQPAYTFRRDGPKIVSLEVALLPEHPAVKLLDKENETALWGMYVLGTGKDAIDEIQPDKTNDVYKLPAGDREGIIDSILHEPDLQTVEVDSSHPYERKIDLSKFYDFSKPGNYKVSVFHSDDYLVKWGGLLASPAIDVTITE